MVANPDGRTPGELLQEARDARRMTLEQLAVETKIPQRLLQALERDEYHKVSGPLYIKSFLRAFAEAVGLDPGEIVTLYDLGRGQTVTVPKVAEDVWQDPDTEVRKVGVSYGGWLRRWGVPLLLLIALAVWWFVLRDPGQPTETATDRAAVETLLAEDGNLEPTVAQPEVTRAESSDATPAVASDVAETEAGTGTAPLQPRWHANPDPALPPARRGDQRVQFSDGRTHSLVLRLLCNDPITVSVASDGIAEPDTVHWPLAARPGRLPAARIVAGRPYSVRQGVVVYWGADDHFNLQLGRFDGVELTLNGSPLETGGWRLDRDILIDGDSATANSDR